MTPQCFVVPDVTIEETRAFKAMEKGEANAHQQALVLSCIIKKMSRSYDNPFIPGESDQTNFLSGRMFVGQQVLKQLKLKVTELHPDAKDRANDG